VRVIGEADVMGRSFSWFQKDVQNFCNCHLYMQENFFSYVFSDYNGGCNFRAVSHTKATENTEKKAEAFMPGFRTGQDCLYPAQ